MPRRHVVTDEDLRALADPGGESRSESRRRAGESQQSTEFSATTRQPWMLAGFIGHGVGAATLASFQKADGAVVFDLDINPWSCQASGQ